MTKLTYERMVRITSDLHDALDQLRLDNGVRVFDPEYRTLQESLLVLERIGKRMKPKPKPKPKRKVDAASYQE